jgi:hypothetical protein
VGSLNEKLTSDQRKEIARKAAKARWIRSGSRNLRNFREGKVSREAQLVGIVSTIVAVLVAILSTVLPPVYQDQLRALPIVLLVLLVVAAALFYFVVPRAARSNRPAVAGIVCSILGVLLLVAFWSGLPIVLGAAGALLGREARTTGGGLALAAVIVGVGAVVLDLVGFLADRLLT